ncbi:DMT family transporter [Kosmotoga arenicorallina]|uniref:DMT family transporter n=1 Tax=Kosmotoga arenicorallina TaxID=688066 RepID=UPI000A69C315|nr:DMT family transporter [Kosmotoga arenicorallina]
MKTRATFMLMLVVLFWGLTFPMQKAILGDGLSPVFYNALRFAIASFFVIVYEKLRGKNPFKSIFNIQGVILGLFLTGGYLFQTWGLVHTTASKSAFITALYVGFVAVLSPLIEKKLPSFMKIVALLISITGLYLLTSPKGGIEFGDFLTILCSVFFALHVIYISVFTNDNADEFQMLLPQLLIVTLVNGALIPFIPGKVIFDAGTLFTATFTAVFATILAVAIQLRYQKHIGSVGASLVYVGEPAFALLFAMIFLGEGASPRESLGLVLMILGIITGSLSILRNKGSVVENQ